MESLTDPQIWIALGTLTFLEIVLGVDPFCSAQQRC